MFGGCNLTVREIKASTKDTDVVVHGPGIRDLLTELEGVGYTSAEVTATITFDSYVIVEREGGIRIDLFPPERIFDGPGFSASMDQRSDPWFQEGLLDVRLADPSTLFLFKSVTGRWRAEPGRDIDDLRLLLTRGVVKWPVVEADWRAFRHKPPAVVEKAREAVRILRDQGLSVPWDP